METMLLRLDQVFDDGSGDLLKLFVDRFLLCKCTAVFNVVLELGLCSTVTSRSLK